MKPVGFLLSVGRQSHFFYSLNVLRPPLTPPLPALPTGASVRAVPHPGGRALLQRARVRALPGDAQRHPELPGIRRQHPPGLGQVGHAGADTQPLAVFQRGKVWLGPTRFNSSLKRDAEC